MSDQPRVRFAPAPSGNLHVGRVRTALFNWLFARHCGGTFVLRIEDTDASRSADEHARGIEETLRWLGLTWDEGPIRQTDRRGMYEDAARRLLDAGLAYECTCTEDELKERNDARIAQGKAPGYDGHCRDLTLEERAARRVEGRPVSIRFRTPDEGVSEFDDLVRGHVAVEWALIPDFVIVRSSGAPVFFLANAVDDIDMGITHVIRGEDLLDSTHRVLAVRRALGTTEPLAFAHLPLLLGPDRAKLSARHGAVGATDLRDAGYLPEAVVNYLSLQGWSFEDGREVAPIDEVVAGFTLERVSHAGAIFDHQKLTWLNQQWIIRLGADELANRALPFARQRFGGAVDEAIFPAAMVPALERVTTLVDAAEQTDFLWTGDDVTLVDGALADLRAVDRVADVLGAAIEQVATCEWTAAGVDVREVITALGLKPRTAMPALYVAIEGRKAGLPLFESMVLLGRERVLHRLRAARALVEG